MIPHGHMKCGLLVLALLFSAGSVGALPVNVTNTTIMVTTSNGAGSTGGGSPSS